MRTDDLVAMLATGPVGVGAHAASRRFAAALGLGSVIAALLMAVVLGVRPDLVAAIQLPMFWVKLAFVATLALASGLVAWRLVQPGSRLAWAPPALAAPAIVMWTLAAFSLVGADPARRGELFFGLTWTTCPLFIALLALPVFVAVIWAMQGLAPTRLRLAGAGAGLAAGSIGALVYSFHCPEMAAPFLAFWYLLGILIPAVVGSILGPRLLRW